jgi:NADH dehydrogenase
VAGLNADALVERVERIRVNEFSQVKGYEDILPLAILFDGKSRFPGHPMMAQPALQQGKLLGKKI